MPAFSLIARNISADKTLKEVLTEKIPQEQENVKAFRKSHGSTKVGEVTVDMVSIKFDLNLNNSAETSNNHHDFFL